MNIFDLFASLKLDTSDYDRGIDDAKKQGDDFADHTEKKVSPKAVAGWMAIVAVIIKVIQSIAKLAKASMDYADTVGDLAAKFGVSTDAISEMQYIADQSSTSIEGMTSAMTMLLNRAKENGDGFKELGINVYDANGNLKQMDELFYETIGALNGVESEGERSRLMLETFGRSAMSIGEVVRKSSDELATMRKEAHDLGVVLDESTIDFASDFNDDIAVLKLQMNSAIASMIAGADDAEERFDKFMGNILKIAEKYLPSFIKFFLRFVGAIGNELMSYAPTLIAEVLSSVIDTIFEVNWFKVGVDIALSIVEGIVNVVGKLFSKIFGFDYEGVNFVNTGGYYGNSNIKESLGGEYEISKNINQKVEVVVEAKGDTPVSQATAEQTAQALAPYLDEILGGR
jgi:hypothetical protein